MSLIHKNCFADKIIVFYMFRISKSKSLKGKLFLQLVLCKIFIAYLIKRQINIRDVVTL